MAKYGTIHTSGWWNLVGTLQALQLTWAMLGKLKGFTEFYFVVRVFYWHACRCFISVYTTNQATSTSTVGSHFRTGSYGHNSKRSSVKRSSLNSKRTSSVRQQSTRKAKAEEELVGLGADQDDEKAHPGPIFLANVVNRPFRYSWMVASIALLVMMTIIVTVSVVYSNQS